MNLKTSVTTTAARVAIALRSGTLFTISPVCNGFARNSMVIQLERREEFFLCATGDASARCALELHHPSMEKHRRLKTLA